MLKMLQRKGVFWGITIGAFVAFFVLAWLYSQKSETVYVIVAALLVLAWTLYFLFYIYMIWFRFIETQLKQYREGNNLASGVAAWLSFFLFLILVPSILMLVVGEKTPDIIRNGYPAYLNVIIAIMPAVLGLLGVQYTITVQSRNRKEDMRLAKKPFLTMKYKIGGFAQVEDHAPHAFSLHFQLKNISENIAIPIGFGGEEANELSFWFPYSPISSGGIIKSIAEIDNRAPFTSNMYVIKFYYKDILDHYYCVRIYIQLSNGLEYETPIVARETLCSPDTIEWLKKTAFTKSEDYWETYEITT